MSEDIATTLGRMMGETIAFEQDAEIFGYPERELTREEQVNYARYQKLLDASERLEELAQRLRDKAWQYRPEDLYGPPVDATTMFMRIHGHKPDEVKLDCGVPFCGTASPVGMKTLEFSNRE